MQTVRPARRYAAAGVICLVLAAFFWGTTFVAQIFGAGTVGPFTYVFSRSVFSVVCLFPIAAASNMKGGEKSVKRALFGDKKPRDVLLSGLVCGMVLSCAMCLQQSGIGGSSAGKAAFLTAIYIIIVPVLNFLLFRKKTGLIVLIAMPIAVMGLFLLCVKSGESLSLDPSDALLIACSLAFATHIVVIDRFADRVNGIMLSCLQFAVAAVIAGVLMLIFETPTWDSWIKGLPAIAYAGVLSGAVAYTLQIIGQQRCEPTLASMIMSLESVFSAISGAIVLNERMTARELIGSALIFAAIILAQLKTSGRPAKKE